MDDNTPDKSESGERAVAREHSRHTAARKQAGESYAEHLARVRVDAESSKALLQAQYKARHDGERDSADTHPFRVPERPAGTSR